MSGSGEIQLRDTPFQLYGIYGLPPLVKFMSENNRHALTTS